MTVKVERKEDGFHYMINEIKIDLNNEIAVGERTVLNLQNALTEAQAKLDRLRQLRTEATQ